MGVEAVCEVSILIVNWNTHNRLRRCLAALDGYPATVRREIVVIDNGSADGSPEMVSAEFPRVRLLRNEHNVGFARAVNRGIAETRSPFILLLNSDTELQTGALESLISVLRSSPDIAAAGAQLLKPDGHRQHSFDLFPSLATEVFNKALLRRLFPSRYPSRLQEHDAPYEVDSLIGACLMMRREAVDSVGILDERYFVFYEETDWCLRARREGWRIVLVPAALVIHAQGESKARHPARSRVETWRSKYAYFEKHRGIRARALLEALSFIRLTAQVLAGALTTAVTLGLWGSSRRKLTADAWLWMWHAAGRPVTMGLAPAGPVPGYIALRDAEGVHWVPREQALAIRGSPLVRTGTFLDTPAAKLLKQGRAKQHYTVTLASGGCHHEWYVKVYRARGFPGRFKTALRGSKAFRELVRMVEAERRGIPVALPAIAGTWTAGPRTGQSYLVFEPLDGWVSLDAWLRRDAESSRIPAGCSDSVVEEGSTPEATPGESAWRTRRRLISEFGRFARRVYEAGIDQDDFNPTNVFVRESVGRWRFLLLDFERVRVRPTVPRHRRLWTIAKMGRVSAWATRTDCVRFLRGVLPANRSRLERQSFMRDLLAARERVSAMDRSRETRKAGG